MDSPWAWTLKWYYLLIFHLYKNILFVAIFTEMQLHLQVFYHLQYHYLTETFWNKSSKNHYTCIYRLHPAP